VHLLPSVAIQSVDFSAVKSLIMPNSCGAFIKASLEAFAENLVVIYYSGNG